MTKVAGVGTTTRKDNRKDCKSCKAYMKYIEDHGMAELNHQNVLLREEIKRLKKEIEGVTP